MADTSYLRREVEDYVRRKLSEEFGVSFEPRIVKLSTGGTHEFDAVSENCRIVAAIKASGGRTATGRVPSGKIKSAEAELYYLSLAPVEKRLLVFTSREFYEIMIKRLEGRLAPGIELKLIRLSPELEQEVARIQAAASREVSPSAPTVGKTRVLPVVRRDIQSGYLGKDEIVKV